MTFQVRGQLQKLFRGKETPTENVARDKSPDRRGGTGAEPPAQWDAVFEFKRHAGQPLARLFECDPQRAEDAILFSPTEGFRTLALNTDVESTR